MKLFLGYNYVISLGHTEALVTLLIYLHPLVLSLLNSPLVKVPRNIDPVTKAVPKLDNLPRIRAGANSAM